MKITIFSLCICFVTQFAVAQSILVADNNYNAPQGAHVFATIQEAVDAASDGDVVQVQPSPNTYGNVSIDKQITLRGIGFNLTKDIPLTSSMGSITLTNNADNTSDADGTVIEGLTFTHINIGFETGPDYVLSNILIDNCSFGYVYSASGSSYSPTDNLEVRGSYLWGTTGGWGLYFYQNMSNILFRNNLILYDMGFFANSTNVNFENNILYGSLRMDIALDATEIRNNVFVGATGEESAFTTELQGATIENNIFFGSTPSIANAGGSTSSNFQNNTFDNNLVHQTGDDALPPSGGGAGNFGSNNLTGSPNFVNASLLNTWSSSYDFTPMVGSPALGTGVAGTDMGITGGNYPWTTGNITLLQTPVPTIETLNTSTVINPGADLPIRVIINGN